MKDVEVGQMLLFYKDGERVYIQKGKIRIEPIPSNQDDKDSD